MRPVILIGHGIRLAGLAEEAQRILPELGIPIVASWPAKDIIDNYDDAWIGCTGIWGDRAANFALSEADTIYCVGNRMSVWNVGYEAWPNVLEIHPRDMGNIPIINNREWRVQCAERLRNRVEPGTHDDPPGGIHPWRFTHELNRFLRPDEVIVTDMGTALVAAHQTLRLTPPQRLMTSGGLGEMGCALPAAVGASFARDKGEVLCLTCDGGMMMNLQELQTIVHHKLPIKIIVYDNQGYEMIRQTQRTAGYPLAGVDAATGVSTPDFWKVAQAFGIAAAHVRTWEDYERAIPALFDAKEPSLVVYHIAPNTELLPKLLPIRNPDGTITSPAFHDMSPRLT